MMTGAEFRALRTAAGLTRKALAARAGIVPETLRYWERKATVNPRGWAVLRIVRALGLDPERVFPNRYARARGWGLGPTRENPGGLQAQFDRYMARLGEREAARLARLRVRCGAKTRKGHPCRNLSEPGKRRCKFHGGKSTGPRTPEGKARIVEALRRRVQSRKAES